MFRVDLAQSTGSLTFSTTVVAPIDELHSQISVVARSLTRDDSSAGTRATGSSCGYTALPSRVWGLSGTARARMFDPGLRVVQEIDQRAQQPISGMRSPSRSAFQRRDDDPNTGTAPFDATLSLMVQSSTL